jgi:hypothetical protein
VAWITAWWGAAEELQDELDEILDDELREPEESELAALPASRSGPPFSKPGLSV